MKAVVANKELWVSAAGELVEAGDPTAETCLARVGDIISVRCQLVYGIVLVNGVYDKGGTPDPTYLPTDEDYGDVPLGIQNT